jgi:hypothetical protein
MSEHQPDVALPVLMAFGDRALQAIVSAMASIRFDGEKRFSVYAVTLHASIVQLCGGVVVLARTEYTAGIPILLRSMYEALVDLDLLVTDANYYQRMDAANLQQMLVLLKQNPTNPLLAGLENKHDVGALTSGLQAELDSLRAQGRGGMHIKERCAAAGRKNDYTTIYAYLCLDAHSNVAALIDRHLDDQVTDRVEINAFGDGNPLSLARRISFATAWMLQSAQFVHGAFRTGYRGVADLQREHEALRKTYLAD